jgi:hypothetical protein
MPSQVKVKIVNKGNRELKFVFSSGYKFINPGQSYDTYVDAGKCKAYVWQKTEVIWEGEVKGGETIYLQ